MKLNSSMNLSIGIIVIKFIRILVGENKKWHFGTNVLSNTNTGIEAKIHATARGLQPPACCGHPAMWWMAKRLHRCVSARMVAKWVILTKTVGEQNREPIKTGYRSINKLSAGDYLLTYGGETGYRWSSMGKAVSGYRP
ncbi:hypothetical protein [Aeromonas enteropelogenes]|uniref:hypothetical protein n=1 Tax=Aeromonas enteropelogenes TaxID=29489 RepID=UPI001CBCA787|nr:hypothetical protein [Aeromonas enteropelogenes]UAK73496.1 hypothetical protein K8O95_08630 [Aeromonas enteropelogenes]